MSDDELERSLAAALDGDAPAAPTAERIAALHERAEAARRQFGADVPPAPSKPTRWLAVAAAAAVALVIGVGATSALNGDDGGVAGDVEFAGLMDAPDGRAAAADLTVTATGIGRVIELRTATLPVLPIGELYELWFVAADDAPGAPNRISAGTFHPDQQGRSDVRLAAAVDPALFPIIEITAEPADGDPTATGPVVLRVSTT